jgi:transposase-like protein
MDAIRTNAEKQHMHKCTDPNCPSCGTAMREMAKDIPITLARGIFDSTQDDLDEYGQQLTEDERILKHHLGSTFSRRYLTSLSKPAYDELLLTAKTHIVAERYGRHRIRPNARGNSPPGFWDVDMPTTQDMEEREWEMQRRNAELVKERHREAMRKGGKWMFKDE